MNSNFNFECYEPPALSAAMLKKTIEVRRLERQTAILAVASGIFYLCIALFAILLSELSLTLSLALVALLFVSLSGSGLISVIFYKKRCEFYQCH